MRLLSRQTECLLQNWERRAGNATWQIQRDSRSNTEFWTIECWVFYSVYLKKNQTKAHKTTTDKKPQTNNETSPKNQNTKNNPTPNKQTSPKLQQTCNSDTAAIPCSCGQGGTREHRGYSSPVLMMNVWQHHCACWFDPKHCNELTSNLDIKIYFNCHFLTEKCSRWKVKLQAGEFPRAVRNQPCAT